MSGISETGDAGTATVAEYEYDPFGRRVWKEVNGNRTYFMYSDQGLIAELGSSGAIQRTYGYRPDRTWMTDPLYLRDDDDNTYYYQNDHLGTPQKLTNVAGSTVWAQESSAFGDARVVVSTVENPLRFAGQYFDGESGLNFNYYRHYNPRTGRYTTPDPIGILKRYQDPTMRISSNEMVTGDEEKIDTRPVNHLYAYANSNPTNHLDPNGLSAVKVIGVGAAAFTVCMKIKSCRDKVGDLVKKAAQECKRVSCRVKRAPPNHKFPGLGFCEHYELTCFVRGKKGSGLHLQFPLPGRCQNHPSNQF